MAGPLSVMSAYAIIALGVGLVILLNHLQREKADFAPRDPENLDPYGPQNHEVR